MKVIKPRRVKSNEEEMCFANNQANDIAGPLVNVIDEGNHNRDNATKGVYSVGQLSNPYLDTPNET